MSRTILAHLNIEVPDEDDRNARQIAADTLFRLAHDPANIWKAIIEDGDEALSQTPSATVNVPLVEEV